MAFYLIGIKKIDNIHLIKFISCRNNGKRHYVQVNIVLEANNLKNGFSFREEQPWCVILCNKLVLEIVANSEHLLIEGALLMLSTLAVPQAIANPFVQQLDLPLQRTIARAVSCRGIGVHSAAPATLTLRPAAVNTGYVFIRKDLVKNNRIAALWHNVVDTMMCTKIANNQGVYVSTIEHVISALVGCHIHNAIIEIDGPEVPIMDGSSKVFVEMIGSVGTSQQSHSVKTLRVLKPIQVSNGQATAFLLPADEPRFTMQFNANGRLAPNNWFFSYYPDTDDFGSILSQARTFGFQSDAEKLWAAGLAKGASTANAIVLNDNFPSS